MIRDVVVVVDFCRAQFMKHSREALLQKKEAKKEAKKKRKNQPTRRLLTLLLTAILLAPNEA